MPNTTDAILNAVDSALRTLFVAPRATRECATLPEASSDPALDQQERQLSGALMRVNHVGEVCAQALYSAQALAARLSRAPDREALARQLATRPVWLAAALPEAEETAAITWTQGRYDLELTMSNGDVTRWAEGEVVVSREVTHD